MSGKSGTDARFPSEVRRNVVNCECCSLALDQKVGRGPFGESIRQSVEDQLFTPALGAGGLAISRASRIALEA